MIRTRFWTAWICVSIVAGVAFSMLFDVLCLNTDGQSQPKMARGGSQGPCGASSTSQRSTLKRCCEAQYPGLRWRHHLLTVTCITAEVTISLSGSPSGRRLRSISAALAAKA